MLYRSHQTHSSHDDSSHTDQHVLPVGHANKKDVVEGVHTINLGEQLVDDGVVHACRAQQTRKSLEGFVGSEQRSVW